MSNPSRRQTLGLGFGAGLSVTMLGSSREAAAAPAAPTFTLLLVNDIYRMGDDKGRGGFAKLAAVVKEERARGVPMLFCHAGRHLLALADVGLRPGRPYRRADEHDPAGRVRARKPRVRFRHGRLFQAHARLALPLLRREHPPGRRHAGAGHEGLGALRSRTRQDRARRHRARRDARHVPDRRPEVPAGARDFADRDGGAAAPGSRHPRRRDPHRPGGRLRDRAIRARRRAPDRARPRPRHRLRRPDRDGRIRTRRAISSPPSTSPRS